MHCIKLDRKNQGARFTTCDIPRVEKDDEIVARVKIAGICGTDLHIIKVSDFRKMYQYIIS